jgi:hypothetical protein
MDLAAEVLAVLVSGKPGAQLPLAPLSLVPAELVVTAFLSDKAA